MRKKLYPLALTALAALTLAACGQAPASTPAPSDTAASETATDATETATETATEPEAGAADFLACMVSDQGGFDDQSFNQTSYAGLQMAVSDLGISEATAESTGDADYAPNIDSMVQQGCNMIIGVGFLLEDPVQAAAEANPDIEFALVDSAFSAPDFSPVELANAKPLLFNTSEAAYLAGYVAAGMSETGKVATFGGMQIPSVAIFMDGFADGVAKYNEDNGAAVQVLGWDKATQNGSFTGDFENQANGQALTDQFIAQGADIVMPVAGPVGLGAAQAAEAAGNVKIIWVDTDGYLSTDYGSIILTSVVKKMDEAVFDAIDQAVKGEFSADPYVGTLENSGVDIAPFHDFDGQVPAELKAQVDELRQQIISGELVIESPNSP